MGHPTKTFWDKFWLLIKGISMGAANKVPGVSGGIVAFVGGFYEEFIYSLQKVNRKALALILDGRYKVAWHYMNMRFLGLLLGGLIISYFTISFVLDWFIVNYEIFVWAFFFGMILGSIWYLSQEFDAFKRRNFGFVILGIAAGIAISMIEPLGQNDNLWFVFLCGMLSVSGMTLPGLSGSFILILLGNYVLLLVDSINAFSLTLGQSFIGNFSWWHDPVHMRLVKVFLVFFAGSITGLVTFSNVLGYAMKHYREITFSIIIGFITGSLGVVWPWKDKVFSRLNGEILKDGNGNPIITGYERYWPDVYAAEFYVALLWVGIGLALVVGLERYAANNKSLA